MSRANHFGDEHDIPRRYDSYQTLVEDPDVDVVYVATPHPGHKNACLLAIEAGKAVLCEKPLTVNASEAREVIAAAQRRHVFIMEAMWTRFLPAIRRAQEWIDAGAIGELRGVHASFGFRADLETPSRIIDPKLAGGALLDVGCYPMHLACALLGTDPTSVQSTVRLHPRWGVDEQSAILLGYEGGAFAVVLSAIAVHMRNRAVIQGTEGLIELPPDWFNAEQVTLRIPSGDETFEQPHTDKNGFHYQVAHVCSCLRTGQTESDLLPLHESLAIMELMDRVRADWGLRYPFE